GGALHGDTVLGADAQTALSRVAAVPGAPVIVVLEDPVEWKVRRGEPDGPYGASLIPLIRRFGDRVEFVQAAEVRADLEHVLTELGERLAARPIGPVAPAPEAGLPARPRSGEGACGVN